LAIHSKKRSEVTELSHPHLNELEESDWTEEPVESEAEDDDDIQLED
jgi:hypothetical protein